MALPLARSKSQLLARIQPYLPGVYLNSRNLPILPFLACSRMNKLCGTNDP